MTKLVITNHSSANNFRGICPTHISIIENGPTITIKTYDNFAYEYYGLTDPDQGCHIWTINRDTFWNDKPDIPNKAGIFGLCGWDIRAIKHGIGFDGAYLSDSLQKNTYQFEDISGPHDNHFIAADPDGKCIGIVILRRHNDIEQSGDAIVVRMAPVFNIQTNLEYEVTSDEEAGVATCGQIPFDIVYTGPNTVGNSANLTFTVTTSTNTIPSEWETFYVKPSKGSTPMTITLANNQGTIPFDASSMTTGEVATITVGLDFLHRSRSFTVTKA